MVNFDFKKVTKVHFIGVGGIFMSSLARYCLKEGKQVSGSDIIESELTRSLVEEGVKFYKGHHSKNVLDKDLVVYTSAIKEENEELLEALKTCPIVLKRSEFLGLIIKDYKKSVAISGSHGKTTTTAMIGRILLEAGLNPTVFLGGEEERLSNFLYGGKDFLVTEACEYKKNFLDLSPYLPLVLNIDNDHLESYNGMEDLEKCFSKFINGGISIVNADDKVCKKISKMTTVFFGIENPAVYTAREIVKNKDGKYSFNLYAYQIKKGRINLKIVGRHNIYNALASFAVADILGADFKHVKRALENFNGVKRRAEFLGKINGIEFYADYAHHPREITQTLISLANEKTLTIFQPHTYSRTENLMEEFIASLINTNALVIYKTYPAREEYNKKGCATTLYNRIKERKKENTFYCENIEELKKIITSTKYKRVLFLGAGDIYDIAKGIVSSKKQ